MYLYAENTEIERVLALLRVSAFFVVCNMKVNQNKNIDPSLWPYQKLV